MSFSFQAPVNSVSFGQVSYALLREMLDRGLDFSFFPIGSVDLKSQDSADKDFNNSLEALIRKGYTHHSRTYPSLKIWHMNGGLESVSEKQLLLTFYELNKPTQPELNAVRNNNTVFTSQYTVDVFKEAGVETSYVPLFFDKINFQTKDKKYFSDDRIVFNLCGKFEKRKHHGKILDAWSRKYGNNNKYVLQCALFNPFLSQEDNEKNIADSLNSQRFSNIQVLHPMGKNSLYNDFLNSGNIIIGMSGGEGWGLPEFHSLGLGKHGVIMNAHSYKGFANEKNSVLVEPNGMIDSDDGLFFQNGADFNQGQLFDFDIDDFIDGCEEAIKRVEKDRVNKEGLKIQEEFTVGATLDALLEKMEVN